MKDYLPYCLIGLAAANTWASFDRGHVAGTVVSALCALVWAWVAWLDHDLRRLNRDIAEEDEP